MRSVTFFVTEEYSGRPLLHFMRGHIKISHHICGTLRHTPGAVKINGNDARVIDKVNFNDRVDITFPENTAPPSGFDYQLDIIYEDEDILVINKPSGISVHPTRNHPNGTLCNAVSTYLISNGSDPSASRAVGRLDKVTSGVMLFAKNVFSASRLNGKIKKKYIAFASGKLTGSGTVDAPIFRPDPMKTVRTVDERGIKAVTHWRVIRNFSDFTELEIETETGRTHQIRVHLSHIGHPLIGDDMYGGDKNEYVSRAALHCRNISFVHPVTGEKMSFTAPLSSDLKTAEDSE